MEKVFRIFGKVGGSALMNRFDFQESEAVTNDRRTAKRSLMCIRD